MMTKSISHRVIFVCVALGVILCAGAAQSQTFVASSTPLTAQAAKAQAVTGAPYSAVIEHRHMQSLANGTHIDLVLLVIKQYRDAQGRTRVENYSVQDGSTSQTPQTILIVDPIAGKRYFLNPYDHTARVTPITVRGAPAVASTGEASAPMVVNGPTSKTGDSARPEITQSSLGADTMLGLPVTGRRITSILPVGSRGNDQPITIVSDSWDSLELQVTMLHRNDDPRSGVGEERVTQIDRAEPDASLFQVPADYTVVER